LEALYARLNHELDQKLHVLEHRLGSNLERTLMQRQLRVEDRVGSQDRKFGKLEDIMGKISGL
jgi:hypothetical protein